MTLHTFTLLQGHETEERVNLLLSLTSIKSEPIRDALVQHYVKGMPVPACCWTFDITRQNFARAVKKLNHVYSVSAAVHGIT